MIQNTSALRILRLLALLASTALASPWAATAQTKSTPVALPEPVAPTAPAPVSQVAPSAISDVLAPRPVEVTTVETVVSAPPPKSVPGKGEIMLNFQGASLSDVLNYLSEAAGFVIVQEAPVTGTVNIVSRQPISAEEAVDLVNAVLIEKGYVAIRNGRILKVVSRKDAQRRDLPVQAGSDPEKIPRKDDMVTQILPLRFGEAAKLVENLRPLLAENATITANESSNAILMTDTQTNIRRIAQIIQAIDTSVDSISTLHVYPLQFAIAKDLAAVITQLFATNAAGGNQGGRRGRDGGGFPGFGGGGDRGGQPAAGPSEARQAASRVVAVADDQSNSLIVSAPDVVIPQITEIVNKIDTSITDITDTRIFRLQHADASELALIVTSLYSDTTAQAGQNRGGNQGDQGRDRFRDFFGGGRGGQQTQASPPSGRALLQAKVVAVGDPRTNSLIITAARDMMTEIAETIGRLDATDAKKQRVFVHSLEHADADGVASVLRGMLGDPGAASGQPTSSRLTERTATGATMDAAESQNTGRGNR